MIFGFIVSRVKNEQEYILVILGHLLELNLIWSSSISPESQSMAAEDKKLHSMIFGFLIWKQTDDIIGLKTYSLSLKISPKVDIEET